MRPLGITALAVLAAFLAFILMYLPTLTASNNPASNEYLIYSIAAGYGTPFSIIATFAIGVALAVSLGTISYFLVKRHLASRN